MRQPGAARDTHVQITADATATVGDIARTLAAGPDATAPERGRPLTLRVRDVRGSTEQVLSPNAPLWQSGLRSGAVVEIDTVISRPTVDRGQPVALLRVIAGPDAGLELSLTAPSVLIGRGAPCEVRLTDNQVSKVHARISVSESGIEFQDLNSANGVLVGGQPMVRAVIQPGEVVVLGETHLCVTPVQPDRAQAGTDHAYLRPPRVLARPEVRKVAVPAPTQDQEPQRFPILAALSPLVMGAALFAFTRSAMSLVFIALSPLLLIGSHLDQQLEAKRRRARSIADHRDALSAMTRWVEFGNARERDLLNLLHPTVEDCVAGATRLAAPLWSRRPEHPEFLTVRLGTGEVRPLVEVETTALTAISPCPDELASLERVCGRTGPAPVIADLRSVGAIGITGAREVRSGVARGVVVQLAALHSPAELVMATLTSRREREVWDWLDWLPHTSSPHSPLNHHLAADAGSGLGVLDELERLQATRSGQRPDAVSRGPQGREPASHENPALPAVVVIVDDPPLDAARLVRLLELGPSTGIYLLWLAPDPAALPGGCRAYLDVAAEDGSTIAMVRTGTLHTPVVCATVADDVARHVARSLAPVIDGGVPVEDESDLPRSIALVTILGADTVDDPQHIVTRWRENHSIHRRDGKPPTKRERACDLRALVGHAGVDPLALDLRTHGPHALVGGTTGAGKSEFLQAWILGMAHSLSPDRLTFLFIDYKGGAAFAKCVQLPHCVGLVTDLSPHLVRRALRSLGAEIRYREHLLNAKGAKDLLELEKSGDPDCPPSLVIVVDEFAALVSEIPEFVDGVVDVAQRGRSLGLHLILATQRPSGVIKDNLRANTNLRIALRMADEDDSKDVLGSSVAAHFDPAIPGRAAVKTGPGRLTRFQAAFPGSQTPAVPVAPPVEVVGFDFGALHPWRPLQRAVVATDLPTDMDRVVASVTQASVLAGLPAPRKPWLDSLAESYNLGLLHQRTDTEIVLGVLDDPDHQRQVTDYFRPDSDGNILVYGAGGSGKSTALRSLAIASSITPRGGPVHVYAVDFGGGALSALQVLPTVGSVILGDDQERVTRLIRQLTQLVDQRQVAYSGVRASTLTEYRQVARAPQEPRILLLLDGFSAFRAEYENAAELDASYLAFQRLLLDGRGVGVHVAMTADRPAAVPAALTSAFPRRIVLRQSDEDAYAALGVPKDVLGPASPPGRAVQGDNPQELQLAILGGNGNTAAQARVIEELAPTVAKHLRKRPSPITALPVRVDPVGLPSSVAGSPVLGIADRTLEVMGFAATGPLVVCGSIQSGRTTAVAWLAQSLGRWSPGIRLVHISPRRSPLTSLNCWTDSVCGIEQTAAVMSDLRALVADHASGPAPVAFLIEDLPDFADTEADEPLVELVKACRLASIPLIAEGEISRWSGSWGLVGEVKSSRTGLILGPDQVDGDAIFKVTLPRCKRADFPPGRGFWVRAGRVEKVHLPLPGSGSVNPSTDHLGVDSLVSPHNR